MRNTFSAIEDGYLRAPTENTLSPNKVSDMKNSIRDAMVKRIAMAKQAYDALHPNVADPELQEREVFVQNYMGSQPQADMFLEHVQKDVPLSSLKQVIRSCHFDENLRFCASISKVADEPLRKMLGGLFVLEVWYNGTLVFQRPLQRMIRAMNASRESNSIIYLLDELDEQGEGDKIHILSLNSVCTQSGGDMNLDVINEKRVPDWTGLCGQKELKDQLSFAMDRNGVLYVACPHSLHAASLNDLQVDGDLLSLNAATAGEESFFYHFGSKTRFGHISFEDDFRCIALFDSEESFSKQNDANSVVAIFDDNSLLSFNQVVARHNAADPAKLDLQLVSLEEMRLDKQMTNSEQRQQEGDPIQMFRHMCLKNNKQVTAAIRQSGHLDIYWNCRLIGSSEEEAAVGESKTYRYTSIRMNFNAVLLRRQARDNQAEKDHPVMLSFEQEQRTTLNDLIVLPELSLNDLNFFKNQKYKDVLKPFQEFILYRNFMLVAHNNILSYYCTDRGAWRCHYKFDSYSAHASRAMQSVPDFNADSGSKDRDTLYNFPAEPMVAGRECSFACSASKKVRNVFRHETKEKDTFGIGVLFQDGTFEKLKIVNSEEGHIEMKKIKFNAAINGRILSTACDREHSRILYIISQDQTDNLKLSGFTKGELYDLTALTQPTTKSKIVPFFAPAANSQVLILEPDEQTIVIYEHYMLPDKEGGETKLKMRKIKRIHHPEMFDKVNMGTVHTGICTENNNFLILVDDADMHIYDLRDATKERDPNHNTVRTVVTTMVTHKGVNIQGLQLIQDRYMYVMYNKISQPVINSSNTQDPIQKAKFAILQSGNGCGFMDLDTLKTNIESRCPLIPICGAIVGCNNQIIFSEHNSKLVILQGFNRLKILPLLHLNLIQFDSMAPKKNYLFAIQTQDKFQALGEDGRLQKWCMQTGHMLQGQSKEFIIGRECGICSREENDDDGYVQNSQFTVFKSVQEMESGRQPLYQQGLFKYALVYDKTPVTSMSERTFYGRRLKCRPNQVNQLHALKKEFHTFVVLGLDKNQQMEVKVKFVFPRLLEKEQNLFVSDDYLRVLEITQDQAFLYDLERNGGQKEAVATFSSRVPRLPIGICDKDPFQIFCLFSPNLERHIDIDPVERTWIVRDAFTGAQVFRIPRTFLQYDSTKPHEAMLQSRFMAWHTNNQIQLIDVNADPFIEEIIEIPDEPEETERLSYEVAAGSAPYLHIQSYVESFADRPEQRKLGIGNYFKSRMVMDPSDVVCRLKRMHRVLKSAWYLEPGGQDIETLVIKDDPSRHGIIYEQLFTVDFVSDPDRFLIETPFTFINWRHIELMQALCSLTTLASTHALNSLPFTPQIVQTISLNILPKIQTVLHLITRSSQFTSYFCSQAQDPTTEDFFAIPFLENIMGETALHVCLDENTYNTRVAEYFFKELLQRMPLDHHGRAIANIIPKCIEEQVPFLGEYLDSRFLTTKQLRKVSRAEKKMIKVDPENEDQKYYISVVDLWPDERLLEQRVYKESKSVAEIEITLLDLPKIHQPSDPVAHEVARALANVEDTSIFRYNSIKAIVNFRWGPAKKYVLVKQMVPYCAFFFIYLIYAVYIFNWDIDYSEDATGKKLGKPMWFLVLDTTWLSLLVAFSLYFLSQEYRQVMNKGWRYFSDIWNYADVVPPVLIILVVIMDLIWNSNTKDNSALTQARFSMQALASFGMWVKILYFLRIFRQTGFFVNMLIRVVKDSQIFFYIYVMTLCAFGTSFFIMSSQGESLIYHLDYSYQLGLGEFNTDWAENYRTPIFMQAFFYAATLVVLIVMLNLLIAIVSTAYEEVITTQQEANDFERADLIYSTAEFIGEIEESKLCRPNEYIIKAQLATSAPNEKESTKED